MFKKNQSWYFIIIDRMLNPLGQAARTKHLVATFYMAIPNNEPILALTSIAIVPHITTREEPNNIGAPPTFAATAPSNAKNKTAIIDTDGII